MPTPPPNPHDAFFRHMLARPADAASELRAVLPEAISAQIEWDTMALQPGSFVSKELRSRYTDLLFRTRLRGHEAYIFALLEHQSSVDKFMALRMLDYMVNFWNQYLREHPDADTLPAVIGVVLYNNHTGRAWTAGTEIADLIDVDAATRAALGPHLPHFRFVLDDVAALDLAALRARDLTSAARVVLMLQKIAPGNTHLGVEMLPLVEDLRTILQGPAGAQDLESVVTYILIVGDTTEADLEPLIDQLGPQVKEAIMTTAERLRAEGEARGEARGRALGVAQGRALGQADGRAAVLLEQLTLKFGEVPTSTAGTIAAASLEQLKVWAGRVLTAGRLDEIFTD